MQDALFVFGLPTITNSTSATISTNVLDAGSAKKLFAAQRGVRLTGRFAMTADGGTLSAKVDFVGADDAALTTNPVVLGSTGTILTDEDGNALATGDIIDVQVPIIGQTVAKRYYGCFVTLGGTNPDCTADAKQLALVIDAQTNMPGARAAIPA